MSIGQARRGEPISRQDALTMLLWPIARPAADRAKPDPVSIRGRIEHVTHAYPFMTEDEKRQAEAWAESAGAVLDELRQGRAGK